MAYDELMQGLARVTVRATKPAEDFVWGQSVLFGGPEIGTDQDVINMETEVGEVVLPKEAVKGLDPTRVNYGISFNLKRIGSAYYFPEDTLDLSAAKNRVFGEPVDQPWTVAQRELHLAAKKRDIMAQSFRAQKEKLSFEVALSGKMTTKTEGEQVYPIASELLAVPGANFITKPFETVNAAAKTLYEHGITLSRIVLNPVDGGALVASAAWQTMLDKKRVEVGAVDPQTVDARGMAKIGTIKGIICGEVTVYAYAGFYRTGATTTVNYIPQGKALLLQAGPIGSMGYTGILTEENGVQAQVAAKELFTIYNERKGALVTTKIQGQTAPVPVITNIDGYGVMTGIPA